ncbi:MAG: ATP-dependent metallopeptidase FtsH/Yme1/Tma family protein [Ruminococcaceae bacterium]|nr:ATP-dependent metallopeptidase FtsH/Yme1/Tma family protein [Oscillospiraceae bacterium]
MKKRIKEISFYLLLASIFIAIITLTMPEKTEVIPYSQLISDVRAGKVKEISVLENTATVLYRDTDKVAEVSIPGYAVLRMDIEPVINEQVSTGQLKIDIEKPAEMPWWLSFLPTFFIIATIIIFWSIFMRQSQGGGKIMNFGKSRAKSVNGENVSVTFNDVAGVDEEKEDLAEIVDFLKDPKKFTDIGARVPKGVLLVGPPGTGKTLLAKAVAGEAGVTFFSISGSDFVEMYVGVGASRVRDLFEQAKKGSPCIIFIDEIDAVGRHRGAGLGGGHDEREQTLNQLLVEMDGFTSNTNIIVIAATNRPDILDPALLRPGRFDRQIVVGYPDIGGREAILKVHARNKKFEDDIDLSVIAKTTQGFTGADLENLLNESALLAARDNRTKISNKDMAEAMIKVIAGPEKKTRKRTKKDRELTAYHEAGHAIITALMPTQDKVHQISIIPRGRAGGYTLSLPSSDKSYSSKTEMLEEINSLLGGRVAEKLVLNDISTGASNDIQRATKIAKDMVTKYGMSEKLGPMVFGTDNDEVFIGKDFGHTRDYSEHIAAIIDEEISKIIDNAYNICINLLSENMDKLHEVAKILLEKEKIEADEFMEIFPYEKEEVIFEDDLLNEKTNETSKEIISEEESQDEE